MTLKDRVLKAVETVALFAKEEVLSTVEDYKLIISFEMHTGKTGLNERLHVRNSRNGSLKFTMYWTTCSFFEKVQ